MSKQTEASDVGQRVHAFHGPKRRAGSVEPGRGGEHRFVPARGQQLLFQRRAVNANAEWLAENQRVTGKCASIAFEVLGVDETDGDQAVNGLDGIDGVTARDRNAGFGA